MTKHIALFIVDDHPVYVDGLQHFINREVDMHIVGTRYDGAGAAHRIQQSAADIVLLDLEMPYDGFKVLEELAHLEADCRVLVISAYARPDTIQRVAELGGAGYVDKTKPMQTILNVIRQVADGWTMFPETALTLAAEPESDEDLLSTREIEVLDLLSQGLTNSEIAERLNISKNTVGFHLKNIFSKLNVSNRTEATIWYFSHMSSFA